MILLYLKSAFSSFVIDSGKHQRRAVMAAPYSLLEVRTEVASPSKIEHKLYKLIVNPHVGGGRGEENPPPKILLVYTHPDYERARGRF